MADDFDVERTAELPPPVPVKGARLGIAFHRWQRHVRALDQLAAIDAPPALVTDATRRRDGALATLQALGWDGEPVRVHHTPYDLDRLEPQSSARVLLRAQVLAVVSTRALLESRGDEAQLRALQRWARGLDAELEPTERDLIERPIGALTHDEVVRASWQIEAAAILTWALDGTTRLAHDIPCDAEQVRTRIGLFTPGRLEAPPLRPRATLIAEFERLWAIHWRLVDFRLRPSRRHLADLAEHPAHWFGPLAIEGLPSALVDGEVADLAIGDRPLSETSETARSACETMVAERRRALGWACGLTTHYADVPMDV